MKTTITLLVDVEVELDETKFNDEFFEDFNKVIHYLGDNEDRDGALQSHLNYLARLTINDGYWGLDDFVEGYGPKKDMGIEAKIVNVSTF